MNRELFPLWDVFVVKNEADDTAALIQIQTGTADQETISSLDLAGLSLAEVSEALKLALEMVRDVSMMERAGELAEMEMRRLEEDDAFPF